MTRYWQQVVPFANTRPERGSRLNSISCSAKSPSLVQAVTRPKIVGGFEVIGMNHNIEYKNFEPDEHITTLLESLITKVERKVRNFSPDAVFLRILIEENSVRALYLVSITMDVPGKTLATKEDRHDIDVAIRDAFIEIERQAQGQKSRLRGEHLWKRLRNRVALRQIKTSVQPVKQVSRSEPRRRHETYREGKRVR